jgi:two-component system, OmpR family, phosphate regulon sensor histidine kinase PhoR
MNTPRNSLSIVLITCSIGLLMALQFFWLRKVYRDEEHGFRKETSFIFRNTMFALNDSALQKSIQPMQTDSSVSKSVGEIRVVRTSKTIDSLTFRKIQSDLPFTVHDSSANIQVYLSGSHGGDSAILHDLKPLVSRIRRDRQQRYFSIRLKSDSIPIATVNKEYQISLSKAGFENPFLITRLEPPQDDYAVKGDSTKRDFHDPDKVILTPLGAFQIGFPGLQWIIVKKIIPQIVFALILTLITISSFILLYRSLRSQQRLMQIKNDFISNMTHELKTPVATVSVALEALKNFSAIDNPKLTQEYLDIAKHELDRLTIMTDKILDISIFESKGVQFEPENTNLDKIIQDMLASMKMVIDKRNAQVRYESEGTSFELMGGAMHLTNLIYNLMDNALKYSNENPMIEITLKDEVQKLVLSVKDNGSGIPQEYQRKVFEKFFRIPSGNIHNAKGYGLGLSYVASVVKSHHGIIDVVSKSNEGSTFIITIPRAPGKMFKKVFTMSSAKNKPSTES